MKRIILLVVGLLVFGTVSNAQQGDGGTPYYDEAVAKSNIDSRLFKEPNIKALRAEDAINDVESIGPWRFGHNHYTDFNFGNSGTWTNLPNGGKVWQLRVICENALTVNLTFADLIIPAGNELYVFNEDKSFILGKFTDNHVVEGQLGAELIPGNTAIVEYYVAPNNIQTNKDLTLSIVTHGYRTASEFYNKGFGDSGNCHINAACPQGVPWANQIRSCVMLVAGANGFCSGSMINNTLNDGTPYVLTANHCGTSPGFWIFRFNWQSATCANPGGPPTFQSLAGGVLRSNRTPSDFCLVEITGGLSGGTVPLGYNTYFNGWDNTDDVPAWGTSVHHPSGDIKKLSFDEDPLVTSSATISGTPSETDALWRAQWEQNTAVEGGSSGSGIFDPWGRTIGQLWGGNSNCGNTGIDYYGKVSYSWEPAGSNSTNQLKFWLDPNNDGTQVLDGFDPSNNCTSTFDIATTAELCFGDNNGSVNISFTGGNSVGATFDIGGGTQPAGVFANLAVGNYVVEVIDGNGCATNVYFPIVGPEELTGAAGAINETAPFNGAINLYINGGTPPYTTSWTGPNGFTSSDVNLTGLESGVYTYIVTDDNGCSVTNTVTVNSLIGLNELDAIAFNLFPNPSSGVFTIQLLDNVIGNYNVEVMDVYGRIIFSQLENSVLETALDLSNSANGTYFLKLSMNGKQTTKRVVVKK